MDRTTYTALAVREGDWWAIEVPELPGVFTQARRLDRAEAMVRDVLSLWLGVPEDSFDVRVVAQISPADAQATVTKAVQSREAADQASAEAARSMREAARLLTSQGLTLRDTGEILGVSYQRVQQITGKRDGAH